MNALKRALAAVGFKSASPGAITPGKAAERAGFAAAGRRQPLWLAYSLPFITTAVTLLVVEAAARGEPVNTPVIVFVLSILLSAYAGGLVPGLLSTVLSTLATVYFVLPPTHSWSVASPVDDIKWITLAAAGTLISFLMAHRERLGTEPPAQHSRPAGTLLLSAQRRVQVGFAVLLTCLIAIAAVSYPTMSRLREDVARVEHSHQAISTLRLLISSTTDAETNVRGYVITGREEFLEAYRSALQRVNHALSEARRLTDDNPEQQRRLDVLEPLIAERLAVLKNGIERRDQILLLAKNRVLSGRGNQLQEQVREVVTEMEATEQALLAEREGIEQRASVVAKIEIVGGSAFAVLIVAAALWMIGEAFTASRSAETALEESRDQLEIRVNERTSELRTSEQRMAGIISSAMDAVITVDEGQRTVLFNPAAEKLFGCNAAEAMGHPLERFIPPRFRTAHSHHVLLFGQSGRVHKPMSERTEIGGLRADGTEFPIEASISQAQLGEKKVFTVILRDITERKRAEEDRTRLLAEVQKRAAELEATINSMAIGLIVYDSEGKAIRMNSAAERVLPAELFSSTTVEQRREVIRWESEDGQPFPLEEIPVARALRGETTYNTVIAAPSPDHKLWISASAAPIRMSDGRVLGAVASFVDITERKRAEEALCESEAQFRTLANAIPQLCWMANAEGWISWYNDRWYEYTGTTPEQMEGWGWQSVHDPDVLPRVLESWKSSIATGKPFEMVFPLRGADGVFRPFLTRVMPACDKDGNVAQWFGTNTDIAEQRRTEEALAQRAQELARSNADLAQFAYVASHDLKEPLRAVSGCVGLLKGHYEGKLDERAGEYMTHIVDGAARMEALIDGLLAYSRVGTQGGELQPVECAKALGTALQNLAASIEESGAVVTHDTLPAVSGDLPQLVSLFQNLIGNALKFRKATPPHIHVSAEPNGTLWHFSVRDNGVGIAPQYFERIFAVFQRLHTRREYPGTGIGLAICKKIVERHGGRIWVESVPGEGATFLFSLLDAQTNHRKHGGEFHA